MKVNIKSFWGKEEKEFERIRPYTEIPPELERKQRIDRQETKCKEQSK